jgi:hypothetical protein
MTTIRGDICNSMKIEVFYDIMLIIDIEVVDIDLIGSIIMKLLRLLSENGKLRKFYLETK